MALNLIPWRFIVFLKSITSIPSTLTILLVRMKILEIVNIKELFNESGYIYKTYTDQILFEPGSIRTIENKAYSVFTPFKRKWLEKFNIDLLDIDYKYISKNKKILNSNTNNFEFDITNDDRLSQWELGEEGAKKDLKNF